MNYTIYYNDIINNARIRQKYTGYIERHHIIPKSIGGLDTSDNIVELTAKEHYIAHHLLYHVYKNHKNTSFSIKMSMAWLCMCAFHSTTHNRFKVTARAYNKAKEISAFAKQDITVYNAIHRSGKIITGTRDELATLMGKNHRYDICSLFGSGSCCDYILEGNYYDGFLWDVFTITNGLDTYTGYSFDLSKILGTTSTRINALKEKDAVTANGFWIINLNGFKFNVINSVFVRASVYKNSIYELTNGVETAVGNFTEITTRTSIMYSRLKDLVLKKSNMSKGWWIVTINGEKVEPKNAKCLEAYICRYVTKFLFFDGSKTVFRTVKEHSVLECINIDALYDLVRGLIDFCSEWLCLKSSEYIDGKINKKCNSKNNQAIFDSIVKMTVWKHPEHGIVTNTMRNIINIYKLDSNILFKVYNGYYKSSMGWELLKIENEVFLGYIKPVYDTTKQTVKSRIDNNTIKRIFTHPEYGSVIATVNEMIDRYKDCSGASIGFKELAKKKSKSYKKWLYEGDV
jgi:hypothetical protein